MLTEDPRVQEPGRDRAVVCKCKCRRTECSCSNCEGEEGWFGCSAVPYRSIPDRSVQEYSANVTSERCLPANEGSQCKRTKEKEGASLESHNNKASGCCVGNSQLKESGSSKAKLLENESTSESTSVADIRNDVHVHCECNALRTISPNKVRKVQECRKFNSPPNHQQGSKEISCQSHSVWCNYNSEDNTISPAKWTKRKRKFLEHGRTEHCYQMRQERNSCHKARKDCNCKVNVLRNADSVPNCAPNKLAVSRQSQTCLQVKPLRQPQPESVTLESRLPEDHCKQSPTDEDAALLSSHEVKTPVDFYLSYRQMQDGLKSWR